MMNCKKWLSGFLLGCTLLTTHAQIPPAEQMLPDDTIGVLTVPEWGKLTGFYGQSPWGQLWADPAMKPFKDKFVTKFQTDFLQPLEKELGISLKEYNELLQGQVTIALTPPLEGTDHFVGMLLLVDAKDKSEALSTRLAELKKKWSESGKELQTSKLRDTDFTVVSFTREEITGILEKAFPGEAAEEPEEQEEPGEKTKLYIGQFKSLFIAGENPKAIEKILARQGGGLVPPLGELAGFQKSQALMAGSTPTLGYAWLNVKPLYDQVLKMAAQEEKEEPAEEGMPQFSAEKILPALGLNSLQSISARLGGTAEGSWLDFFVSIPEGQREGIFKILSFEKKEAAPPAFVPADAIKFQRWRIDAQKAYASLEEMLNKIDPSLNGMVQLMLGGVEAAGKEQDPDFSFKKNFIGNLGDDFIAYEKAPKSTKLEDIASAPALFLVGSPNPSQLVEALRVVTLLATVSGPPEEREFLGKKIYTLSMAAPAGVDENGEEIPAPATTLSFCASGGYVALSTDNSILEEYLRSGDGTTKPLREVPGLAQATQKVGGNSSGLFTYEDQVETMRIAFNIFKNNAEGGAGGDSILSLATGGNEEKIKEWVDFSLLPPFEQISKYFSIVVMSGATTEDGLILKAFGPTSPELRK